MKLITSYKGVEVLSPETKKIENNNDTRSLWDDSKNERSFDSFGEDSTYKAWWKCPECGYEWTEPIVNVVRRKKKCPRCRERYLSIINNAPIMKYWDWDKNKEIDPGTLKANSKIKANWKCPECGYEWQDYVSSVSKKKEKCRKCKSKKKSENNISTKRVNCFLDTIPELKKEFVRMLDENDDARMQGTSSRKSVIWRCSKCGYEWKSTIRSRIIRNNDGYQIKACPACNMHTTKNAPNNNVNIKYYLKYPVLNEIYSFENNSIPISELDQRYMDKKLTFSCLKHGNYKMTLRSMIDLIRKGRTPCPECRKEKNSKSLADAFPDLALDWSDKNEQSASEAKPFSDKVVHWKCHVCGTEWDASIFNRTRGSKKCPKCSPQKKYADRFPELKNIFDSNANGRTADSLKYKDSKTSFIWLCNKHGSYERKFSNIIAHLKNGENPCPQCYKEINKASAKKHAKKHAKKKLVKRNITNPLSANHPDLVKEWSLKNDSSPNEVSEFSRKEVIWKCQKCGNEWKAKIIDRSRGFKSCPICSPFGKRKGKYLSEVRPDLKKHYSSENEIPFESLSSANPKSVIWVCDNGHKFTKTVAKMTLQKEFQCPKCTGRIAAEDNNIIANHPELINEWDAEKNKIDPYSLMDSSRYEAYWKCKQCGHRYRQRISRKLLYDTEGKISCPYCANRKASDDNNLTVTNPEVLKEWNYEANDAAGINPHNALARNGIIAHWICSDCGSHYDMAISERVQRENDDQISCPYCRGWLVNETNCLAFTNPEVLQYWDYEANDAAGINPHNVLAHNVAIARWICPDCSSHYDMAINERIQREDNDQLSCPYCRGRLINETNCLKNTHPELMKEWAANENALIEVSATEISDKYNGKAWWICPVCNYKYTMSVQARCLKEKRHQNACPRCNGRLQKRLHFL